MHLLESANFADLADCLRSANAEAADNSPVHTSLWASFVRSKLRVEYQATGWDARQLGRGKVVDQRANFPHPVEYSLRELRFDKAYKDVSEVAK